jgi:hypothetical protein|tara:strand:- start:426 stop:944 length:519 start_codon:yes stop_codon:yes gene_type:complete
MEATKSHVKVWNITPEDAEDFEYDFDCDTSSILTELVPSLDNWGGIPWIELEEYEYNPHDNTMHLSLETKWAPPTEWLRNASMGTHYFQNKLITMSTIQKDETLATGVAVMDGEVLQNKELWSMESEEVGKYYNDDEVSYDLDELDNQIWDAIGKFVKVCEQFYLEGEKEND